MKTVALALLLATLPPLAQAAEQVWVKNGFLTGNSYRELAYEGRVRYVAGYVDGALASPLFASPSPKKIRWLLDCLGAGIEDGQIAAMADKWLRDNPARWHESMNILMFSVLSDSCPK